MSQTTVQYKGNTFLITRVTGIKAWTVRNVNHNTFVAEVEQDGDALTCRVIEGGRKRTISASIIGSEQELGEWCVKHVHDDLYGKQR